MDLILSEHVKLLHRLDSITRVEELKQFFDHLVDIIKNLTYTKKNADVFNLLNTIADDLATFNALKFFNHLVLIHHPIFVYIGRTLEMLLTKSTHSQSIPMAKHEENCFYSLSYLISQLCSYRNEPIEPFYGLISNEIQSVTEKINIRDENIGETDRKSNPIASKPNVKIVALPPSAPKSRPIEQNKFDITKIIHLKKFPPQPIQSSKQTTIITYPSLSTNLPSIKYQDIFFTKSFLDKLNHAIEDLSQHDYSPFHVKYKVIDRLVRICSKINLIDSLLNSIIKCLHSKFYEQAFLTIESEQWCLNPKQLFFIYRCPRVLIEHESERQEEISNSLCQKMIEITQSILKILIPTEDESIHLINSGKELAHHTLHYHLEFLNYLTLTSINRRYFIQNSIINQLIQILQSDQFHPNSISKWFDAHTGIISNILILLSNLAYEKEIFTILKQNDLQTILFKYQSSKKFFIQYPMKILNLILNEDEIDDDNNEPIKLKKNYIESFEKLIIQSKEILKVDTIKEQTDDYTTSKQKKNIVLTDVFLETLIRDVEQLSTKEYSSNKLIYKDVSRRIRVCTKQDTIQVEKLLDPIVKCLQSKFYFDVFKIIELNQTKGALSTKRTLSEKHLFFMRECSEFLFRHNHRQYVNIAETLGKKILSYTDTIFKQHLPIFFRDYDEENSIITIRNRRASQQGPNADDTVRIEALYYHIKMLIHFTQTQIMRKEFLQTSIIDEILRILNNVKLASDKIQFIRDAQLLVIGQSLILLFNLISEDEILRQLENFNIQNLCFQFGLFNDKIIHFSSQILSVTLNKEFSTKIYKPDTLSKTAVEYIERSIYEPKYLYQGIRLDSLLTSLKRITKYETFTDYFIHEKDSIFLMTKCVCIETMNKDDMKKIENIQKTALTIIWTLSHYGSMITKTLKQNHKFIEQLLILSKKTPKKFQEITQRLIWRFGDTNNISSKSSEKIIDDEQLPSIDKWDESISYDLLISVSNNTTDRVLITKIYNRLTKKGYRIYSENQSQHRLELMRKAIERKKTILICLSKHYRSSKLCMAEAEYAQKKSCPIIPILIEPKFKIQGWLKFILGESIPIEFSGKDIDKTLIPLCDQIEQFKNSD